MHGRIENDNNACGFYHDLCMREAKDIEVLNENSGVYNWLKSLRNTLKLSKHSKTL